MLDLGDALAAYEDITTQLADLQIERSEAFAAELSTRAAAYADLCSRGDRNITQIREEADHAAHMHKMTAIRLGGQVDALQTRLRWLDVWVNHLSQGAAPLHPAG